MRSTAADGAHRRVSPSRPSGPGARRLGLLAIVAATWSRVMRLLSRAGAQAGLAVVHGSRSSSHGTVKRLNSESGVWRAVK